MKSAHERAAYSCQHPAVAAIQRQAAERSKSQLSSGRSFKGACAGMQRGRHARQGSSSPDAAAAAALSSSAAARRIQHCKRHRRVTSRQLRQMRISGLIERLANKHTRACISLCKAATASMWPSSRSSLQHTFACSKYCAPTGRGKDQETKTWRKGEI
jgi:hypothetical protein